MAARFEIRPEWLPYITKLVDSAPPLSPAQLDRLAVLLTAPPTASQRKKTHKDVA